VKLLNNPKLSKSMYLYVRVCVCVARQWWAVAMQQQFGVAKICESQIITMDMHLILWSTRATLGISASKVYG
jgi:hypothetical protein